MKDLADTLSSDLELTHHLQRQILRSFLFADSASYSDLLPDGMAGNAFLYHLRALIRNKLLIKQGDVYNLTPLGRLTIESMSIDETRFKIRPVCGVFIAFTDEDHNVLCITPTRQPLIGRTGLLFAKLRLGEAFEDAANRVYKRRFGEDSTATIESVVSINVRYITSDDDLVTHRMGVKITVRVRGIMPLVIPSKYGALQWYGTSDQPRVDEISDLNDFIVRV